MNLLVKKSGLSQQFDWIEGISSFGIFSEFSKKAYI